MYEEIWKDIAGYEGIYQVSSKGRIKSLARRIPLKDGRHRDVKDHILNQCSDKDGYLSVNLYKNCHRKNTKVHRIVAEAFILNPYHKPVVNHLNEIKNDNRKENLEWATVLENTRYGNGHLRLSKAVSQPVFVRDLNTGFKKIYSSALSASDEIGVSQGSISHALRTGHLAKGRYEVEAM
jgi:hypothetical protein